MRMQTHAFFLFVFLILSLKVFTTLAVVIQFSIIERNEFEDYLTTKQVIWINSMSFISSISEVAFDAMMIVYLAQPYLEKDNCEDIVVN